MAAPAAARSLLVEVVYDAAAIGWYSSTTASISSSVMSGRSSHFEAEILLRVQQWQPAKRLVGKPDRSGVFTFAPV
jgi:hypothetical protein